eukprot:COSAG02_NODE_25116_length_668_cov_2.300527_2_plen_75_part_01
MYRFGAVQGAIVQLGLRNAMNEFTTQNHHLWLTRGTGRLRPVISRELEDLRHYILGVVEDDLPTVQQIRQRIRSV